MFRPKGKNLSILKTKATTEFILTYYASTNKAICVVALAPKLRGVTADIKPSLHTPAIPIKLNPLAGAVLHDQLTALAIELLVL